MPINRNQVICSFLSRHLQSVQVGWNLPWINMVLKEGGEVHHAEFCCWSTGCWGPRHLAALQAQPLTGHLRHEHGSPLLARPWLGTRVCVLCETQHWPADTATSSMTAGSRSLPESQNNKRGGKRREEKKMAYNVHGKNDDVGERKEGKLVVVHTHIPLLRQWWPTKTQEGWQKIVSIVGKFSWQIY